MTGRKNIYLIFSERKPAGLFTPFGIHVLEMLIRVCIKNKG
jgi:hypothetical protein